MIFPTATGKTIVAAVSPITAGDKVIVATTASGQKIVFKSGAGETGDVDPCTSLTLAIDPVDPTKILVSWTPGANNTAVHYEYATGDYPDTLNSGDLHRTIGVSTTSRSEPVLMYYVWHYVCIWGVRNGKYSSTFLQAAIVAEPTAILQKFKEYITLVADTTPTAAGESFNIITGGVTGSTKVIGTFSFQWSGQGAVRMTNIVGGVKTWTAWMDDLVIFTQNTGPHSGETVEAGSFWYWGYVLLDITSICNVGQNSITIEVQDIYGGAWGWGAEDGGANPKQIYFGCTDPNAITDSWWVQGDDDEPPAEEHNSGVSVRNPWNGGLAYADVTLYFNDGGTSNNDAYIAYKMVDPDHGVLHIWAAVNEHGRAKELWAGDTQLCSNIEIEHTGLTYDGYLTISEL